MILLTNTVTYILSDGTAVIVEAEEPNIPKNPIDMTVMTGQKKGPLCMIIRLGSNPHCQFVNGIPPPVVRSTITED